MVFEKNCSWQNVEFLQILKDCLGGPYINLGLKGWDQELEGSKGCELGNTSMTW
jgi:hypothetical protein